MKIRFFLLLQLITFGIFGLVYSSTRAQSRDIVIGQTITINSKILNEDRDIMIRLPAGYQNNTQKYPVLYLLDGEGHFHYATGVIEYLSQINVIPQMIVIGIPNVDRGHDFTPTVVQNVPRSGGASQFLKFLGEELIPYIDQNYRTQPYRILAGHSFCGLFALYTLLNQPGYFNSFIGMSPWVSFDNGYIVNEAKSKLKNVTSLNKTFYFTTGSLETTLLPTINNFVDLLKNEAPRDLNWNFKLLEGEDHGSLMLITLYDGLKYIFKDWVITADEQTKGLNAILQHYTNLSEKYGYEVPVGEATLNNAAYQLLLKGKLDEAIQMFKKNSELHPESANVYDSLGEAYERSGQMKLAKENYEKAYEIASKENNPMLTQFRANYERLVKVLNN